MPWFCLFPCLWWEPVCETRLFFKHDICTFLEGPIPSSGYLARNPNDVAIALQVYIVIANLNGVEE